MTRFYLRFTVYKKASANK